jgi:hypothetical protein
MDLGFENMAMGLIGKASAHDRQPEKRWKFAATLVIAMEYLPEDGETEEHFMDFANSATGRTDIIKHFGDLLRLNRARVLNLKIEDLSLKDAV